MSPLDPPCCGVEAETSRVRRTSAAVKLPGPRKDEPALAGPEELSFDHIGDYAVQSISPDVATLTSLAVERARSPRVRENDPHALSLRERLVQPPSLDEEIRSGNRRSRICPRS